MILLAIALGGGLGAVARYTFSALVYRAVPTLFPTGTFVVNVAGCLAFGVVAGVAEQRLILTPATRAFVLTGLLGGFTTFSSFAFESVALVRDGHLLWAALNMGGQVTAGAFGLWAAYLLTR